MDPEKTNLERIEQLEQELQQVKDVLRKLEQRLEGLEGPRRKGVICTPRPVVQPVRPKPKPPSKDFPPPPRGPEIG